MDQDKFMSNEIFYKIIEEIREVIDITSSISETDLISKGKKSFSILPM